MDQVSRASSGAVLSMERVKIAWLDRATFYQFLVSDAEGDSMVFVEELTVDYRLSQLLTGDYLKIEDINLKGVKLDMLRSAADSTFNITSFIRSLKSEQVEKEGKSDVAISIESISIDELSVVLLDSIKLQTNARSENAKTGVDLAHLDLEIPYLVLLDFQLSNDTIKGNLHQFSLEERNSAFKIDRFNTAFNLCEHSLGLDDLLLQTPTSVLSDSLEFFYNGYDDFSHFIDSVSFVFHFEKSLISQTDLRILTGVTSLPSDIELDGIFWGSVGDFNVEDARIAFGESSFFEGGLSCFGLPNIPKTFLLADITDSHLLPADLSPYIGELSENLSQMGQIDFQGSFAGFLKDFVARGNFYTDQGKVYTDINIKIPEDARETYYKGNVNFESVNIGAFLQNDFIQQVNLRATIEGTGLTRENADFEINTLILESEVGGYMYDSISYKGRFASDVLEGFLVIEDPNCKITGTTKVDVGNGESVNVQLSVDQFVADSLRLSSVSLAYSGAITLDLKGFSLDSSLVDLRLDSTHLVFSSGSTSIDSLLFSVQSLDSMRSATLLFPGFYAALSGDFLAADAVKDLSNMLEGYRRKLQMSVDTVFLSGSGKRYKMELIAEVNDLDPYMETMGLPYGLSAGSRLEAEFRQGKSSNLSVYLEAAELKNENQLLRNVTFELNGAESINGEGVLTSFLLQADELTFAKVPSVDHILIEGVWSGNDIDMVTELSQVATSTDVRLESNFLIEKGKVTLKMLPSYLKILDDNWKFNPTNSIEINRKQLQISHFEIFDSSESISLNGYYSGSDSTYLSVFSEDLNLDKFRLFSVDMTGFLNGGFDLFRSDPGEAFKFSGDFFVKDLAYDSVAIGDIEGTAKWQPRTQSVFTSLKVDRQNFGAIEVLGYYNTQNLLNQLDFVVNFSEADLQVAEPFLATNFSHIKGTASGLLRVSGMLDAPKVVGNCSISNGEVLINYLNTQYQFNGTLNFDPSAINLENFRIIDRKGARSSVTGAVRHQNFKDFLLAITIDARDFEVLNTTYQDNSLYYGSAYVSGGVAVSGPMNDLLIQADVKTDAGTRFFIPISESTEVGQGSYITFVDVNDTTASIIEEEFAKIEGLTLDFDLEITPEAYCELIFDIKTGDIIKGNGKGNLKLRLNTDGEFTMLGPLEIVSGSYNFTFFNIINKEFTVASGSTISWYGDPYNAKLDIEAKYLQRASMAPLSPSATSSDEEISTSDATVAPFYVVLNITEGMLSPNIDFAIDFVNESDASAEDQSILADLHNDEQELQRQVISLLLLKKFSTSDDNLIGNSQGSLASSVSEFLSSQASYFASQIDDNLEVELDLSDLNNDAVEDFQLRFAYTFLDGRLKVSRGGGFGDQEDETQSVLDDIVGDWSVEYTLTKDGKLRAKVFSNSNQEYTSTNMDPEAGASLLFVSSFDDFRSIFFPRRQQAILRKEEEESNE